MPRKSKPIEPTGRALQIESVPIDSLVPHPKNVRQGDLASIVESIEVNGCYRPVIVQRSTRHILAGNHLWQALKSLGHPAIDAVFIDCDDERATRIMLADNRTASLGTYNDASLAELLTSLTTTTDALDGTGYDSDALDELLGRLRGQNIFSGESTPEAPRKAKSEVKASMSIPPGTWLTLKDEIRGAVESCCSAYGITVTWPD